MTFLFPEKTLNKKCQMILVIALITYSLTFKQICSSIQMNMNNQ